jgi:signal transduction histidine kinase
MAWNTNTIGWRLFLAFSILAFNVIVISSLSYYFISQNKSIYDLTKRIENERIQILRLLKLDLDFLRFETINQRFYETNQSEFLISRDSLYDLILSETILLHNLMRDHSLGIGQNFDSLNSTLRAYNRTFNQIKERIRYRGFKDYGVEGRMRKFAHELENHSREISMVEVLSLRRHEKDYFLRKEKLYKKQFNTLSDSLITKLNTAGEIGFVVHLLQSYKSNFNQLAAIDEEIGLLPTLGLMGQLNAHTNIISAQLTELVDLTDQRADTMIRESLFYCIIAGVASLVLSFILTYITALRLTRPIKKLSNTISRYMVTQGLDEDDLRFPAFTHELGNLSGAFIAMTRKLKTQFDEIQRKSHLLENRNQELQKLNEELDRFIYSSAHDLKSPLASMTGLIHLAQREMSTTDHHRYFDKMTSSVEKMEGFIRDITDYAKNKRQQIRPEKIDLQGIVSDIFLSLQFIPGSDRIRKAIDISHGEFHTDKTRLEIILKNLISNAVRYADLNKESPVIRIEAEIHDTYATIRIIDNGIGIAQLHIARIFEMFYRANDEAKGSGIGLFLVRESVKMLRGTIQVESVLDKGTSFLLTLPNLWRVNVNNLPETEPIKILTAS